MRYDKIEKEFPTTLLCHSQTYKHIILHSPRPRHARLNLRRSAAKKAPSPTLVFGQLSTWTYRASEIDPHGGEAGGVAPSSARTVPSSDRAVLKNTTTSVVYAVTRYWDSLSPISLAMASASSLEMLHLWHAPTRARVCAYRMPARPPDNESNRNKRRGWNVTNSS